MVDSIKKYNGKKWQEVSISQSNIDGLEVSLSGISNDISTLNTSKANTSDVNNSLAGKLDKTAISYDETNKILTITIPAS